MSRRLTKWIRSQNILSRLHNRHEAESAQATASVPDLYMPLDKNRHEIRLMRVIPSGNSKDIMCQLDTFDLESAPLYTALSYEWGHLTDQRQIVVNGLTLLVRHNLWNFLHHRGGTGDFAWIWIDALCINQSDLAERSDQVAFMAKIYFRAERVLAWLGIPTYEVQLAFRLLTRPHPASGHSRLSRDELMAVRSICEVTYWSRLWVLQELVLARNIMLCVGGGTLPWSALAVALADIETLAIRFVGREEQVSLQYNTATADGLRGLIVQSPAFSMLKQTRIGVKNVSLLDRVVSMSSGDQFLRCAVSHDRVYALLGICKANRLLPDYTLDEAQLARSLLLHADESAFANLQDFTYKAKCVARTLGSRASRLFELNDTGSYREIQKQFPAPDDDEIVDLRLFCWAVATNNARIQKLCITCHETMCRLWMEPSTSTIISKLPYHLLKKAPQPLCSYRLLGAAGQCDVLEVQRCLTRSDAQVNCRGLHGVTPLHLAAQQGNVPILSLLLERRDLDVNLTFLSVKSRLEQSHYSALMLVAEAGNEAAVRQMLRRAELDVNGEVIGHTVAPGPLQLAILGGHEAVVSLLLERPDLVVADEAEHSIAVKSKLNPLILAIQSNHPAIVRRLLQRQDVDVNCKGLLTETPLEWAIENGYEVIANKLLSRPDLDVNYSYGERALVRAVKSGNERLVHELLKKPHISVNSNYQSTSSPLHCAVAKNNQAIVDILLRRADLNASQVDVTNFDVTALVLAAKMGYVAIVHQIMDKLMTCSTNSESLRLDHNALEMMAAERPDTRLDKTSYITMSLGNQIMLALQEAGIQGHQMIGDILLERAKGLTCSEAREVLHRAASGGLSNMVAVICQRQDLAADDFGVALWQAAERGYDSIVTMLLETRDLPDDHIRKAVQLAARGGHQPTVAMLLETMDFPYDNIGEALKQAAKAAHTTIVAMLLKTKNPPCNHVDKALQEAAKAGQKSTVAALLTTRDFANNCITEALHQAAETEHSRDRDIVTMLLERRHISGYYISTALARAIRQYHSMFIVILLESIDVPIKHIIRVLQEATAGKDPASVVLLLETQDLPIMSFIDAFKIPPHHWEGGIPRVIVRYLRDNFGRSRLFEAPVEVHQENIGSLIEVQTCTDYLHGSTVVRGMLELDQTGETFEKIESSDAIILLRAVEEAMTGNYVPLFVYWFERSPLQISRQILLLLEPWSPGVYCTSIDRWDFKDCENSCGRCLILVDEAIWKNCRRIDPNTKRRGWHSKLAEARAESQRAQRSEL
ncbi:Ankyrin-1 [Pseudocercospora fuligena]|uniref:Ankyrin-1 n=1 Tax=Pseudocercospora fuligena TaxID=685502 RepID=A0A8H6VED6_9PEZI|nr:Ankyrin-1 [Pseudocercospora fuligena]